MEIENILIMYRHYLEVWLLFVHVNQWNMWSVAIQLYKLVCKWLISFHFHF